MAYPVQLEPTVDFTKELKLMDIYKMYSDRVTAIRQIMLALLAVSTATVSAVIALRASLTASLAIGLTAFSVAIVIVAAILKVKVVLLVREYEKSVGLQAIFDYQLLPLDSLRGPLQSVKAGESIYLDTYSGAVFAFFASCITVALVLAVTHI